MIINITVEEENSRSTGPDNGKRALVGKINHV